MLRREFAAARIAGEGAQFLSRLGLENVDAHGLSLSDLTSGLNAADKRRQRAETDCARADWGPSPNVRHYDGRSGGPSEDPRATFRWSHDRQPGS